MSLRSFGLCYTVLGLHFPAEWIPARADFLALKGSPPSARSPGGRRLLRAQTLLLRLIVKGIKRRLAAQGVGSFQAATMLQMMRAATIVGSERHERTRRRETGPLIRAASPSPLMRAAAAELRRSRAGEKRR